MPDIFYKKTGDIFNQHSYWTKQPVDAVKYFLKKYSNKEDRVLDPFCGSGMTGIASNMLGMKCILGDLSPACLHISEGYNTKFDFLDEDIEKFLVKLKESIGDIYLTNCKHCGNTAKIKFEVLGEFFKDKNHNIHSDSKDYFLSIKYKKNFNSKLNGLKKTLEFDKHQVIQICYQCKCNKTKLFKDPDLNDQNLIIKLKKICKKNPNTSFFGKETKRNIKKKILKVYQLYSSKNLYALNYIKDQIEKIDNKHLKKFLLFNFTSILFNCSLMSRYRGYENTSIKMGTYYVPPLIKDNNVLESFIRKVKKTLYANRNIYKNISNNLVKVQSIDATRMNNIKTNSIDIIYTDPPYSDIINYSELNLVWDSWLSFNSNYKNEMVICEETGKSFKNYFVLFEKFLNEASRVLKINKKLILIFNHPRIDHWSELQKVIINSKFKILDNLEPFRIVSNNKTSSQHKTNKKTQSFIAIVLENKKKANQIKLDIMNEKTVNQIYKIALERNYTSKSQQYDFLINYSLTRYNLNTKEIFNLLS